MTTLATLLPELGWLVPELLRCQARPGTPPDPGLVRLDLADDHGLTKKGHATVAHLRQLADLLDLPLA